MLPSVNHGTLLSFVMEEKAKHSDKVVLVRVGDFYESFGIDAVMLVEHAGSFRSAITAHTLALFTLTHTIARRYTYTKII